MRKLFLAALFSMLLVASAQAAPIYTLWVMAGNGATVLTADYGTFQVQVYASPDDSSSSFLPFTWDGTSIVLPSSGQVDLFFDVCDQTFSICQNGSITSLVPSSGSSGTGSYGVDLGITINNNTTIVHFNVSTGTPGTFTFDYTDSPGYEALLEIKPAANAGGAAVPEPASLSLFGTGALALLGFLRRRRAY